MKVALLHYSSWPEVGGVEQVLRDQAMMLRRAGHEVKIICGTGAEAGDGTPVQVLPELAPEDAMNRRVRSLLDQGQADQNFNKYRAILAEALERAFLGWDVVLVHNLFTMPFNLAATRALHDLAPRHRLVAWTHDLVAGDAEHLVPNPTMPPWNLMQTTAPQVAYVAASRERAARVEAHLKPSPKVRVIPNPVDLARLFGFTEEMRASLAPLDLPARDFVFLLPARLQPRKNAEFAFEAVRRLCEQERNPLLLITGAPDAQSSSAKPYGDYLRHGLTPEMLSHLVFVHDFFPVEDDTLRDLYLLADCLFFPSREEGFGLPVIEAGLYRLPVWCRKSPALAAIEGEGCFVLEEIGKLDEAVAWLEQQPGFRRQRQCRRLFDPARIHREHLAPLLEELVPAKKL
jgi:glycosyltransferase involved in cell wall biosynthesis